VTGVASCRWGSTRLDDVVELRFFLLERFAEGIQCRDDVFLDGLE